MRPKTIKVILLIAVVAAGGVFWKMRAQSAAPAFDLTREIKPVIGNIRNAISSTGTVLPKNRLEVKPSVNGRIEDILVKEGQSVRVAETLAWMSSTDRASILDAARAKGPESWS